MQEHALREAIVAVARVMNERTNNRGRSGNVSARAADGFDGFLVTPSGMNYDGIAVDDVVAVARRQLRIVRVHAGVPHPRRQG